jgi:hypothetical protein
MRKTTGLSLAEAHASGRKYRRGGNPTFIRYTDKSEILLVNAAATDWEIEPEAKLLTRDDIDYTHTHLSPNN